MITDEEGTVPHPNPPPCGEGGRQAGGVLMRSEVPSPTPPHKGEGLHAAFQLATTTTNIFVHKGNPT